jgi:putative hydrolase of the HAD superfamily
VRSINQKYQAIIFDLFGTLVDNFSLAEYESVLAEMASVFGAPYDGFRQLWLSSFRDRVTGVHPDQRASIEYICRTLKVDVSEAQLQRAFDIRLDFTARAMIPKNGAMDTLEELRATGHKTALISDCSGEVPLLWRDTPFAPLFDVTVFSCVAGVKKPDPRIYRMATDQLAVAPQQCLYIGDGSSRELTGALQFGMNPVLIRDPDESVDAHYIEREDDWGGPKISSLQEVLDLLQ